MLDIKTHRPPSDVIGALAAAGWCASPATWMKLSGGRTNNLWTFTATGRRRVCKLFLPGAATPMFRNDAGAEALALGALLGTGLAPTLRLSTTCPSGDVLVYNYVPSSGTATVAASARTLARLHEAVAPAGLGLRPAGPEAILSRGDTMLHGSADPRAKQLRLLRPGPADHSSEPPVFLHGDPVPANFVASEVGTCLIDWQCPVLGDATEDLGIYLSPAMQYLYGDGPLAEADVEAFLSSYGDPKRTKRYLALAPAYHYRMAAYCLWKVRAGDRDYNAAADLEISRLKQLS